MNLDLRSQMAVNLCASLEVCVGEKFRQLARICAAWGFNSEESMPLAHALRERLDLSEFQASQTMIAVLDGKELELRRRN